MKRKYLNILLSISIASVFIGCGSGGGGGTSTGSTCNNHAGSYNIINTVPVSCTQAGVSLTEKVIDNDRYNAIQSGCTLTLQRVDGSESIVGTLNGDTWTHADSGSGTQDGISYTYSANSTIVFGNSLNGTTKIVQTYSNGAKCTGDGVITGSKL